MNPINKPYDALWVNATLVSAESNYGLIKQGAIATKDGKIVWLGKEADLSGPSDDLAYEIHDVAGRLITPGLIDCHTHLVYAGNRAQEFEKRLSGVSYAEITRAGGGINSTVLATRQATEEELFQQSLPRAQSLMQSGVTTLEIKSGYGLNWDTEKKILRVAKRVEETLGITIIRTFLGAHTIPKEFKDDADSYVELLCEQMIPQVAYEKLASAVDVFCETIAFNLQQTERIFATAKTHGLQIKCHAEQLSNSECAALAAEYDAISVDHLEYVSERGVQALAKSKTIAVLLPGAFYFLQEKQLPPIKLLQKNAIPIALASDSNPGTSPILSLLIILNMACILFRLTPEQALLGVTQNAAKALAISHTHGSLTNKKAADFAIWNVTHPAELAYYLGGNPLINLIKNGKILL